MTHAPGFSAYNYVERRIASLSRALAGVVIPHDSYGSHLNPRGKTVDAELEKKNFIVAENILCQITGEMDMTKTGCSVYVTGNMIQLLS